MRSSKTRFQFSVKQLLIGIALASFTSLAGIKASEAIAKKRTIDRLQQVVHITVSHEVLSLQDRFIGLILVNDYVNHVEVVGIGTEPINPDLIEQLSRFSEAKKLTIVYHPYENNFLPLSKLENVEEVFLESSICRDITFLKGMYKLKKLTIVEGSIDRGMEAIGSLNELTYIRIKLVHIPFTDESFNLFCNASSLETLDLGYNYSFGTLTDLEPLTKLRNLESLSGLMQEGNSDHHAIAQRMPKKCRIKFEAN